MSVHLTIVKLLLFPQLFVKPKKTEDFIATEELLAFVVLK
jgi:hypothetical protein